jgi:hypothetical protein
MVAISRASLPKLEAFKKRMGWSFQMGLVRRHGLQPRLRRGLHAGGGRGQGGAV